MMDEEPSHGETGRKLDAIAILAVVTASALWGSNLVAARAIHETVPVPVLSFWRWFLALIILLPFAGSTLRREAPVLRSQFPGVATAGIVGVGAFSLFLYLAAYSGPVIEVGLLNASTPMWVFILALSFYRKRPDARQVLSLLISAAGVVLILARGDIGVLKSFDFTIGGVWALLAATSFAVFSLAIPRYLRHLTALSFTIVTASIATVLVFLPVYAGWIAFGGAVLLNHTADGYWPILVVVYIAIGPTLLANVLWIYGTGRIGAHTASPFMYISPIASSVLAIIFLGEELHAFHLYGFAIIISGLVLLGWRHKSNSTQATNR